MTSCVLPCSTVDAGGLPRASSATDGSPQRTADAVSLVCSGVLAGTAVGTGTCCSAGRGRHEFARSTIVAFTVCWRRVVFSGNAAVANGRASVHCVLARARALAGCIFACITDDASTRFCTARRRYMFTRRTIVAHPGAGAVFPCSTWRATCRRWLQRCGVRNLFA
jgi:hypothetical protein